MLTKKKLTKLLNPEFRKRILSSISKNKLLKYKIPSYARYVTDSQIVNRNKEHENDKSWAYGFQPVNFLCAVLKNGQIDKRLFEFTTVNHFLKLREGENAIEVVMCILVMWIEENKNILDFDMDVIDAELARIEHEYLAEQKRLEKEAQEKKAQEESEKEKLENANTAE